jgi:hypothetical protein
MYAANPSAMSAIQAANAPTLAAPTVAMAATAMAVLWATVVSWVDTGMVTALVMVVVATVPRTAVLLAAASAVPVVVPDVKAVVVVDSYTRWRQVSVLTLAAIPNNRTSRPALRLVRPPIRITRRAAHVTFCKTILLRSVLTDLG